MNAHVVCENLRRSPKQLTILMSFTWVFRTLGCPMNLRATLFMAPIPGSEEPCCIIHVRKEWSHLSRRAPFLYRDEIYFLFYFWPPLW